MKKTSAKPKKAPSAGANPEDRPERLLLDLLRSIRLGEMSYSAAAERETNEELKALYGQWAEQKDQYAQELAETIRKTAKSGAPKRLQAILDDADEEGMIATADDAEALDEEAVQLYRAALDAEIASEARDVVEKQYSETLEMKDHLEEIKSLEFNTEQDDKERDKDLGRDILP